MYEVVRHAILHSCAVSRDATRGNAYEIEDPPEDIKEHSSLDGVRLGEL